MMIIKSQSATVPKILNFFLTFGSYVNFFMSLDNNDDDLSSLFGIFV